MVVPGLLWLAVFAGVPLGFLATVSLWKHSLFGITTEVSLDAYRIIANEPVYARVLWQTLRVALVTTLISLVISYPLAMFRAQRAPPKPRRCSLPALTSYGAHLRVAPMPGRSSVVNSRCRGRHRQAVEWLSQRHGAWASCASTRSTTPPDLHVARPAGSGCRGGERPRRQAPAGVPPRGAAAHHAGGLVGLHHGVPALLRRLRHAAAPRRHVGPHARQRDRRAVPADQQLAPRRGAVADLGAGGDRAPLRRRPAALACSSSLWASADEDAVALGGYAAVFYAFLYAPIGVMAAVVQ